MPRKKPTPQARPDVKKITADEAVPHLLAGSVFTFYSLSQGWHCSEKNVMLPCCEYDRLRQRKLIENGHTWSPEQEQERQNKREEAAKQNKDARLQHYYDQLTNAFECGGTRRERVFKILEDIWSRAGCESISDPFTK